MGHPVQQDFNNISEFNIKYFIIELKLQSIKLPSLIHEIEKIA